MGSTFSYTKIHNEIDNEVDYQAYQARLKRKEQCIKNFQPHIDFLKQEYEEIMNEIDSYEEIINEIDSYDFQYLSDLKYLHDLYQRRRWNIRRQIEIEKDIDRL